MELLLAYFIMVTVPHKMVGLGRMSDCRGVGVQRFHCTATYCKTHWQGLLYACSTLWQYYNNNNNNNNLLYIPL